MNAETFLNDIPVELFVRSHSGISFTPEKYGESDRNTYAAILAQDYANLLEVIADKPEMQETLDVEFARYREGYKARTAARLQSESRCISWMITGPANFPTARNEKRNRVAQKRSEEVTEFRKRALAAIRKTLCPELRPIMSGDADAPQRLAANIAEAEKEQGLMKATNAAIRSNWKHGQETVLAALVALGHSQVMAVEMIQPGRFGGMGYASFELTNNGANIRRMKQRLEGISRNQTRVATQAEGENARLEDCPADNRVRLFFPGKPSVEVRSRLKSSGFRWTPSLGCWQAYRNYNAMETAKREAGLEAIAA